MRTKSFLIGLLLCLLGTMGGNMQAQSHLRSLMKRCESIDNVKVNVVKSRNAKTGKISKCITSINFSSKDNPELWKELVAALTADAEKADQVVENKLKGKMVPTYFRIEEGNHSISFSLNVTEKTPSWYKGYPFDEVKWQDVSFCCIERFEKEEKRTREERTSRESRTERSANENGRTSYRSESEALSTDKDADVAVADSNVQAIYKPDPLQSHP